MAGLGSLSMSIESMWRNFAEEVGFDPHKGSYLRRSFYQHFDQIEQRSQKEIKEEKERADIAERKVELLQKELDILYDKYVETKAQTLLQSREDGPGLNETNKEGFYIDDYPESP